MWKSIKNYENCYQVNTDGEVRSLDRKIETRKGVRTYKGKILTPNIGTNGYYYVILSYKGINETAYIHKLVANTFLTNPNNLSDVDHINGNKLDNRVDNLQYLNHFDNASKSNKGENRYDKHLERNPKAKTVVGVKDGILIETIDCAKKLVEKYGINYSTLKYKLQNNKCVINGIYYHYET
jgi:hypothetical protein